MSYSIQFQVDDGSGSNWVDHGSPIVTSDLTYIGSPPDSSLLGKHVRAVVTDSLGNVATTLPSALVSAVAPAPSPTPTSSAYWKWEGDNLVFSNTIDHWVNYVQNGAGEFSSGTPNPSFISLVSDGLGGQAARLTIAPGGTFNPSGGIATSLANPGPIVPNLVSGAPWTQEGQTTYYATAVRFPLNLFHPSAGNWNIAKGWHTEYYGSNGISTYGPLNSDLIIKTNSSYEPNPGSNPRLAFLLRSGQISGPYTGAGTIANSITFDNLTGTIVPDQWYHIVIRVTWYPDNRGQFEIFVNGQLKASKYNYPTMATWQDGTVWPNGFGLYNYRGYLTTQSSVDFGYCYIGPDLASVGY